MDTIDIKILSCLSKNARANASEIAETVKLSTSAVIERIKKLENNGTIKGYTAILDAQKLNKDVIAMMSVAIDHPKYNDGFVSEVMQNHHITECLYIAGDFDYLLKVITDNTHTLEGVLNCIKSIPGVSKTKTNIVLSTQKNEYAIPLKAKK
ncbi:MAG: Lrp/AsnC family transcriptional regulator [Clostridia bacterium]